MVCKRYSTDHGICGHSAVDAYCFNFGMVIPADAGLIAHFSIPPTANPMSNGLWQQIGRIPWVYGGAAGGAAHGGAGAGANNWPW